jgi:hypothetical protein
MTSITSILHSAEQERLMAGLLLGGGAEVSRDIGMDWQVGSKRVFG